MSKKRITLPKSYYNNLSYLGTFIAGISLIVILFLFFFSHILNLGGAYSGLFTFIIVPSILIIGLLMIPVGMIRRARRLKDPNFDSNQKWPKFDLNDKSTWNAFMIFAPITILILILTSVGSYQAFHFTESVEFCGKLCHKVMEPEYVAYQHSSHAKIACVQCHVGNGASWYVRSKLSGLYQVYAVLTKVYPKPITTPIKNLRPARETCEECHWPQKFYPQSLVVEKHYLADENNTEWNIYLQMKTGSMNKGIGLNEGIHWHINPNVKIEYKSSEDRGKIPYVKYTNKKTGKVTIYKTANYNEKNSSKTTMEDRLMDCMDCHNRPSHNYQSPMKFFNALMASGKISKDLPDIKIVAMEILNTEFPTKDSAFSYIKNHIIEYYSLMYEDIFKEKRKQIDQAIKSIQEGYAQNIFPFMKVKWENYPNHIGHLEFNGCFRCHDNKHVSTDGKMISMECNLCHKIVAQGTPSDLKTSNIMEALEFEHPNDPNQGWKKKLCYDCHKKLYKNE